MLQVWLTKSIIFPIFVSLLLVTEMEDLALLAKLIEIFSYTNLK